MPKSQKRKGGDFERRMAAEFSLWWTGGARDDVFWRTAGSGARAKGRGRKGLATSGQAGDLAATDPCGEPLIRLVTLELKSGYNKATFAGLVDKPFGAAEQVYECWIRQAVESHGQAGSLHWGIVHKRDARSPILLMPSALFGRFRDLGAFLGPAFPEAVLRADVDDCIHEIVVASLGDFFRQAKPDMVRRIVG